MAVRVVLGIVAERLDIKKLVVILNQMSLKYLVLTQVIPSVNQLSLEHPVVQEIAMDAINYQVVHQDMR